METCQSDTPADAQPTQDGLCLKHLIRKFIFDASAAVTVDYVVLTGLVVGLGYGIMGSVGSGTMSLAGLISDDIGATEVGSLVGLGSDSEDDDEDADGENDDDEDDSEDDGEDDGEDDSEDDSSDDGESDGEGDGGDSEGGDSEGSDGGDGESSDGESDGGDDSEDD